MNKDDYKNRLSFLKKEIEVKKFNVEKALKELETLCKEVIQLQKLLENDEV